MCRTGRFVAPGANVTLVFGEFLRTDMTAPGDDHGFTMAPLNVASKCSSQDLPFREIFDLSAGHSQELAKDGFVVFTRSMNYFVSADLSRL
jgi:hypothetical protein